MASTHSLILFTFQTHPNLFTLWISHALTYRMFRFSAIILTRSLTFQSFWVSMRDFEPTHYTLWTNTLLSLYIMNPYVMDSFLALESLNLNILRSVPWHVRTWFYLSWSAPLHATIRSLTCKVLCLVMRGSVPYDVGSCSNISCSVPLQARTWPNLSWSAPLHATIRSLSCKVPFLVVQGSVP